MVRYCFNCGSQAGDKNSQFCKKCGASLSDAISTQKNKSDLFFLLGILYLLIMAFLIIIPTKTINENFAVTYTDNETYYVQESYTVQEPYQVQESYLATEYQTSVDNAGSGKYFSTCGTGCSCSHYTYNANKIPSYYCDQCSCSEPQYVTKYRTVIKYQTITKYKNVPKTRDVIKTRNEPRPVEVNWVLGFKTPYKLQLPLMS